MLLPLGLDNARLSRLPVISIAIAATCVVVLAATWLSSGDARQEAAEEAIRYLLEHRHLDVPVSMSERFGIDPERFPRAEPPAGMTEAELAAEQAELEELAQRFVDAQEATLQYRLSLVKARGPLQAGWITYQFAHGGLLHLLGNLFIFLLLTGPFLEDAWGRLFFLGFYLLGGVAAAAFELPYLADQVPLLGASGSICACLGAFALRFAHRRVRMLWVLIPFIFLRKQFMVPAWLYALFGFAMDLLNLQLSGGESGTAYAAHVGGFLFGAGVALVLRWTGLERRIAPEGAVRWREGMAMNRAAESLAAGDVVGARARLEEALQKRPSDLDATLELARIQAGAFDLAGATERLEPVLARRLAAGDLAAVRALAGEFQGRLRADRLRPATAYRLAEVIEREDPAFSLALLDAAGAAGGGLGAKALLRAAERVAAAEPERARALLARADGLAADPAVKARIEAQRAALPAPPDLGRLDGEAAGPLPADAAVRENWCRVSRIDGGTLDLVMPDGKVARLGPERVALVAAALLERLAVGGAVRANGVVLDLVLRPRGPGPRVVLRIAGHEMALGQHRPGVSAAVAFAELVEAILLQGGADAWPDPARVQGRPFARYPDLARYEEACFGRRLAAGPAA